MKIAGVIIAGGRSSRMGGKEKLFVEVAGQTLLGRIHTRLLRMVEIVAINANGDPSRFAEWNLTVIPDRDESMGTPLAGLQSALWWARDMGCDRVLTVPSDTPFLPTGLVDLLSAVHWDAAIAASLGQPHYITGLWATSLAERLDRFIAQGGRRAQDWARESKAATVEMLTPDLDPFFNINMPEDLAEAERIAAEWGL